MSSSPSSSSSPSPSSRDKSGLHPRNRRRQGYDFPALVRATPSLAAFVRPSPAGSPTIDFADPAAVTTLNRALLHLDYGIGHWEIPPGYLCPPIPGRADYVHHLADLLADGATIPRGRSTAILDIGVGANCIYPLVGAREYGWRFVGTDIDPAAVASARNIVAANPGLADHIEIRLQPSRHTIFGDLIAPRETFAATLCNPPFHASAAEAAAGAQRKLRNLHGRPRSTAPVLNFGGQGHELWCAGGEAAFICRMIAESAQRPDLSRWFTTLVAKKENLPALDRALRAARPTEVRLIELAHGQKKSRIVAWRFAPALAPSASASSHSPTRARSAR